ncbi:MAG TPA: TrkH family potassium uptake protein [Candidatus Aenigmarchaeota archaeon]|nr:TrkH family potassium uptake protein [Candidatus Aenigmarchaeota archaeon]
MPVFDSVLHTLSSVSTGGFSPRTESVGFYNNPAIEVVIIFLMLIGSTSFFVHDKLLKRNFRQYVRNPETRLFWILIIIFSTLLSFSLLKPNPFRHGIFYTFSALTTTGFTTLNTIPSGFPIILLICLMLIGGYAGSTAGGMKLIRFGVIAKSIPWLGRKMSLPEEAVVPFKLGEKTIRSSEAAIISLFVCVYFAVFVVSSLVLVFLGYPVSHSFFETASAQGTVGLSVIDIRTMHPIGKLVLMVDMLLGRVEIFPFLVLMYAVYSRITSRFMA